MQCQVKCQPAAVAHYQLSAHLPCKRQKMSKNEHFVAAVGLSVSNYVNNMNREKPTRRILNENSLK